ncbi:MAG TPA: 2-phospho-L-lactate transferase [Actinomycetota bacterium]|nr:2-phospho-L-lactate transferase [Actinomycetota bacterium]
MELVALAGGVGAGKLLRGLQRLAFDEGHGLTVIVNTADDIELWGLHVSPDLDSVVYWLAGGMDRERGWGRGDETFRVRDELEAQNMLPTWFALGDRDLATHLYRTELLREGWTLTAAAAAVVEAFELPWTVLPMSDDPVTTMVQIQEPDALRHDVHFQEYWVRRGAEPPVRAVRFEGAIRARPAPGVLEAIRTADAVVICPSNPVVSIGPILAVPGIRDALWERSDRVVGISPIVGGTVLAGMADKLMPVVGLEVSALGAAKAYEGLLTGWVVDGADRDLAPKIEERLGIRVAVTDTIMRDDRVTTELARTALDLLR